MAFIRRITGRKVWIAVFKDATGKRRYRSTATRNRAEALKIANSYEKAHRDAKTANQVRSVMAEALRELGADAPAAVTPRAYAETWLAGKRRETSERSHEAYSSTLGAFLAHLGDRADRELGVIGREDIRRFRDARAAQTSARTANNALKIVRMFFKAARRDALIEQDPCEFVPVAKVAVTESKRAFTLDEIKAVLAVADSEWQSLVIFALYTGQRLGDLSALTWSNLDLVQGVLRLTTGKTGRPMTIPLAGPLRAHIATLSVPGDAAAPLHPRAHRILEEQGKVCTLSRQFGELLAAAGLAAKTPHSATGKGRDSSRKRAALTFHTLRATATTLLHAAGVPLGVVQGLIGHSSDDVHRLYVRLGEDAMREGIEKLPDVR